MIGFVAGAAVGYVLGARAGRQRYEQIKRQAIRAYRSEPVQQRLDAAGHAVKTQALPFVADKIGDAVKAAGAAVKDKASPSLQASVQERADGTRYAAATPTT